MTQVFPRPFKERFIEGAITFGVIAAFIFVVVGGCTFLALHLNKLSDETRCTTAHVTYESISRCMSDGRCTYTARDIRSKDRARKQIQQCAIDQLNQVDGFDLPPLN